MYNKPVMSKVSVIIPTYNRAPFLKKALSSVLSQTYRDFDVIVVDDGSSDDTRKVISRFKDRVDYVYQTNKGPAASRNTGISHAKASLVAFLDSDDCWDKEKLKLQVEAMEENPSYPISHTQEVWYRDGKLLQQKQKHKKYNGYIFDKSLISCVVSMATAVIRKELFRKIGTFDESLPCCEDYDFWLRTSIKYPFLLVDKPLTSKHGGRPDQVSAIYTHGMDKFRIQSILKILKDDSLSSEQKRLARCELKKKCLIYGQGCVKRNKLAEGKYYLELIKQ